MRNDDNFVKLNEIYNIESDEEDQDDARHYNLLKSVKKLTGKDRINGLRNEAVTAANRIKSSDKISLRDLIDGEVTKDISKSKKVLSRQKILAVPALKGEQERIRRIIGYEEVKKVVSKWDPVVKENRRMKQMTFPLDQNDFKIFKASTMLNKVHEPLTEMEKEVSAILNSNSDLNFEKKFLSKSEQRALDAMSLAEAQERRSKLQKQRVLMSYFGSKMKRDGKIKSKRHHRLMRKTKQKEVANNLEHLKDHDPHAYKLWLLKQEKNRAEERMTLKHKGGSRHMKKQTIYGKYNKESRQAVHDMIQLGKERTTKNSTLNHSDDEQSSDNENTDNVETSSSKNPWLINKSGKAVMDNNHSQQNTDNSDDEVLSNCSNDLNNKDIKTNGENDQSDLDSDVENLEITKRFKFYEDYGTIAASNSMNTNYDDVNKESEEDEHVPIDSKDKTNFDTFLISGNEHIKNDQGKTKSNKRVNKIAKKKEELIDVGDYLKADIEKGDTDRSNKTKSSIQMAFEDDNILEEFIAEKRCLEQRDMPKHIDLSIPGWGEWTGPGIKISRRKKKKVPTATLR